MKVCNKCGANIADNAPFCPNCGAAVQQAPAYPAYQPLMGKTPITVGGWIGRMLIPCIPLVGGIVYFIMLFIWSGDVNKEESFRNWAKATLILTAIGIVLAIICYAVLASFIKDMMGYMYY